MESNRFFAGGVKMQRSKIRLLALSLASFTVIAGITAYFTSGDEVTNSFEAASLQIKIEEPSWKNNPVIVPEEKIDKDPYIVNTNNTSAYVFMKVTVPAQEVIIENASVDTNKGKYSNTAVIPLFRFVNSSGEYTTDQFSYTQLTNIGWYLMPDYPQQNVDSSDEVSSYSYLYAYTGNSGTNVMAALPPSQRTATPLFNEVIFCNAREDEDLSGSKQHIQIEVFGIQTDFLKSSDETETEAEKIWQYLAK